MENPLENTKNQQLEQAKPVASKPQERGSIQVDATIKIFDPKSGEVFLEARG
jgi:hypothetical protein